ncbi:metallophosphoesterase [Massilia sp. erpn]|uniref:metallophosphoesterase n=1 Tax=Massilia sp. erpn TaxID=2738142 RepID=UPI0021066A69|nr:metallophosphoesterase [Massilia sp. erpn]UTY58324.1 hypothetical protein HPQ68_14725 [Massilia sp. erpn]
MAADDDEDDYEAFLHIVHVSDMHYRDGGGREDHEAEEAVRKLAAGLRGLGARERADSLLRLWHQGLAGHDPWAHDRMRSFLRKLVKDRQFQDGEIWLVDTGDLSSMGDLASLEAAHDHLQQYCNILHASQMLTLYGNHDAWPGCFPARATPEALHAHRTGMRDTLFPSAWPLAPLSIPIPHTESRVLLHAVSSAIDDRLHNSFAVGKVGIDPNWLSWQEGVNQLQKLAYDAESRWHDDGVTRDFRILAVHHPIHFPERPSHTLHLSNDKEVAQALIRFGDKNRGKLAQLILSGHTHVTFPPLGKLPREVAARVYEPLRGGQLQLIAGSLLQAAYREDGVSGLPEAPSQEFQVLSFFAAPHNARRQLVIERRVACRHNQSGDYAFQALKSGRVEAVAMLY